MEILLWIIGILVIIGLTTFLVMETIGATAQAEIWIRLDKMEIEQQKQTRILERLLRRCGEQETDNHHE